jgi:hypothetical protein
MIAATSPAQAQPSAERFERQVRPFAVYDSTGARLRFPFLGGFNRPRPQLVDIDADGDRDLFVQERAGRVMFFEHEGEDADGADAPLEDRLAFRSASYRDLDVGQWYRFADMDADGDADLLAEQPVNYVRYYRNTGPPAEPRFTAAADTLRTTAGAPLFADRRNRPAAFRAGCGGSNGGEPPGLMFGGLDGYLRYFRNVGVGPQGLPQLELVSERFQDVCAGPPSVCGPSGESRPGPLPTVPRGPRASTPSAPRQAPRTARHGANALAAGDLDADGDEDLLWGDFFSASFYRIENSGPCSRVDLRRTSDTFPPQHPVQTAGFNAADLAPLGSSRRPDLIFGVLGGSGAGAAGTVDNLYLLEHTPRGFRERSRRLLSMIDAGAESAPAFADLDGDDDPDLALGSAQAPGNDDGARLAYFENTASARSAAPELRRRRAAANPFAALPARFGTHPAFADLDGDGDPDLALGAFGGLTLYENTGRPGAPQFAPGATFALPALPNANYFAPAFADLEADGDPDLVAGTSGGTLVLFRNEGNRRAPDFTLATERFGNLDAGGRAAPAFRDADGDSDLDLYVGSRTGLRFYENTGAAGQSLFPGDGRRLGRRDSLALPMLATPAFAALGTGEDPDERSALVTGSESGGLFFFALRDDGPDEERTERSAQPVRAAPNPFRGQTTLRFRLDEAARVRLTLYDARGRRLRTLFEGRVAAGQQVRVPWRAGGRASGVYFFRLIDTGGSGDGDVLDTGSAVLVQ